MWTSPTSAKGRFEGSNALPQTSRDILRARKNISWSIRLGGDSTARQGFQLAQYLDRLVRKGHDVLLPHLHTLGGDAPFGFVEVDLRPLRLAQFAGPNEDQWG